MKISSKHYNTDWKVLNLDDPGSQDWKTAIEIFKDRITHRFIVPINALIKHEEQLDRSKRRFGFVIVAIDCLLIETLQAFRTGKLLSDYNPHNPPPISLIIEFLKESPHFNWEHWKARTFCRHFRNGILHQAETTNDSLIRSDGPLVLGGKSDNGLIINRTEFHRRIELALSDYLEELRDNKSVDLRKYFRKKMSEVCRENLLEIKYPRDS